MLAAKNSHCDILLYICLYFVGMRMMPPGRMRPPPPPMFPPRMPSSTAESSSSIHYPSQDPSRMGAAPSKDEIKG